MTKENLVRAIIAGLFSTFTIGILTLLTYKTELGVFIIASFGSSMVLLYGYPESPFAQPKNIFFGHLLTSCVGVIFNIIIKATPAPTATGKLIYKGNGTK